MTSTATPPESDAENDTGSDPDLAAAVVERGATVAVACECGRRLKVPRRMLGRSLRCPFCRRPLRAESEDDAGDDAEPAPATRSSTFEAAKKRVTEQGGLSGRPEEDADAWERGAQGADAPRSPAPEDVPSLGRRVFEALLDPRAVHWLLMLGGGLAVIGGLVWLISKGVFDDPLYVAAGMIVGTLAGLGAGWWVSLKTRYAVAGRALTSLACAVAPLTLWFLHAQGLVTVDGGLWVGGVICCLLYLATVFVLRDPLYLYAIQGGVILTVLLLLGDLHKIDDPAWLSLFLIAMGLIALHAERAFPPERPDGPPVEFSRRRYGRPLFWGGRAAVAISLLILAGVQAWDWGFDALTAAVENLSGATRPTNLLAVSAWAAAGVWLAGAYAFIYSELVVRRSGYDLFNAAGCAAMAGITVLVAADLRAEWYVAALGVIALLANAGQYWLLRRDEAARGAEPGGDDFGDEDFENEGGFRHAFHLSPRRSGLILNALPLALGAALHWRATSRIAEGMDWEYPTDWAFVAAMTIVAVCNRVAAWLFRETSPRWSATCLFFTGAALLIGAAGALRALGASDWLTQAPLLMLVPLAYLLAARLWRRFAPDRGRQLERPLYWVAEGGAAVILAHVLFNALRDTAQMTWVSGETTNLWLGATFLLAAAFYFLAALWYGDRRFNIPLAAAASAGVVWQALSYLDVPSVWHAAVYALLGLTGIVAARWRGTEVTFEEPETPFDLFPEDRERAERERAARERADRLGRPSHPWDRTAGDLRDVRDFRPKAYLTGRGAALFYCGAGVLLVAVLAAGLRGLGRLALDRAALDGGVGLVEIGTLLVTAAAAAAAALFAPLPGWRRTFAVASVALLGVAFLDLNVLLDLNGWRKLEIFCVAIGLLAVAAAMLTRVRALLSDTLANTLGGGHDDLIGLGLWLGGALVVFPPLIAVLVDWFGDGWRNAAGSGLTDQLVLITLTVGLLVVGLTGKAKAPTLLGGTALGLYLLALIATVAYRPQVEVGVYLGIGGLLLFAVGVVLSVYRDRLSTLPDRIAARDGMFRILDWR